MTDVLAGLAGNSATMTQIESRFTAPGVSFQKSMASSVLFGCLILLIFLFSYGAFVSALAVLIFVVGGVLLSGLPVLFVVYAFNAISIMTLVVYLILTGQSVLGGRQLFELYEVSTLYFAMGYCAIAMGIRFVLSPNELRFIDSEQKSYIDRIFILVLIVYLPEWLSFRAFHGGSFGQIGAAVLEFRSILFIWLVIECIVQRRGAFYLVVATLWIAVPGAASERSLWAGPMFGIGFATLAVIVSNESRLITPRYRQKLLLSAMFVIVLLGGLGLFWNSGLKVLWRTAANSGAISENSLERLSALPKFIEEASRKFRLDESVQSVAERLSAGVPYFALVIARVPDMVPYQDGRLAMRAVNHVLQPRFLFPDKENLGSDSDITSEFTGLVLAGAAQNTSIGLGYIPQFYIDFGIAGMIVGGVIYGMIIAMFLAAFVVISRNRRLAMSICLGYLLLNFNSHASDLAKNLGAVVTMGVVFCILIKFMEPLIEKFVADEALADQPLNRPGTVTG